MIQEINSLNVIPYGLALYGRLLGAGIVDLSGPLISILAGAVLMLPFILLMHKAGDYLYQQAVRHLIR